MECPRCSTANRTGRRFCTACGAPLEAACPACGFVNQPDDRFCGGCGIALAEATGDSPPPEVAITPARADPLGADAERRHATILFCDLSGYTALGEKLDPEQIRQIMERIRREALQIVEAHEGTFNQFRGDEVMALFGLPAAHEDDPVRAVNAARQIHQRVRELSAEVEGGIGRSLRMHSGINSGLLVAYRLDDRSGRYSLVGDAVNTAARLAAVAQADEIVVGPVSRRALAGAFVMEPLEPVQLKGKQHPLVPYRVVGPLTEEQASFSASRPQGLTPLIGRNVEMNVLLQGVDSIQGSAGRFFTVAGEPGVGKSRLLYEFERRLDPDQVAVVRGQCHLETRLTPYFPFLDTLRRSLELSATEGPGPLQERLVSALLSIDPALERYLPAFLHMSSLQDPAHPLPAGLSAEGLRHFYEEAWSALTLLHAQRKPLVMILDDWHWADEASIACLQRMVGLIEPYPVMVVVLYRPDAPVQWGSQPHHRSLVLQPLGRTETASIAAAAFQAEDVPDTLVRLLHERSGGNPFFTEEIALGLLEDGSVQVEAGHVRLQRALDTLQLPGSVEAMVRSRLDRLDQEAKESLSWAAVIGREFARSLLERLTRADPALDQRLETLRSQDLIRLMQLLPEARYRFRHALIQLVTYETLLHERRRRMHGQVAHTIEMQHAQRLEEHYEIVAHHYMRSDQPDKAIEYSVKAGEKAESRFAMQEAVTHYTNALQRLDAQPLSSENEQRRYIDLTIRLAATGRTIFSTRRLQHLLTSEIYARELKDPHRNAEIAYWMAFLTFIEGDLNQARVLVEHCAELNESLKDGRLENRIRLVESLIGIYAGELSSVSPVMRDAVEYLIGCQDACGIDVFYAVPHLAHLHAYEGETAAALTASRRAQELMAGMHNKWAVAWAQFFEAHLQLLLAEWPSAAELAGRARGWMDEVQDPLGEGYTACCQGIGLCMGGEMENGLAVLRQGIDRVLSVNPKAVISIYLGMAAELLAASGELDAAARLAQQGLERKSWGECLGEPLCLCARAMVDSHASPADQEQLRHRLEAAIAAARAESNRNFLASTLYRAAEVLHKHGDQEGAVARLHEATAQFDALALPWWQKQAEAFRMRLETGTPFPGFLPLSTP